MVKSSGGSGRGEVGGYSKDVGAVAMSSANYDALHQSGASSFSSANGQAYIKVNAVTEGSERQIEWATGLKASAMRRIDEQIENVVRRTPNTTPAQREQVYRNRNKLLAAINADRSARHIIDIFKNTSAQDFQAAWRAYFPK